MVRSGRGIVATGQPLGVPMKQLSLVNDAVANEAVINGAVFDASENRVLSWPDDGTVRLWDTATGQRLGTRMRHDGRVNGAVFDKAEHRIPSSSEDGTLRMHGNLIAMACRLLADKDISTLQRDFAITITDPFCAKGGRDAPAPDINSL
jgi:WD40 repeat protein